MLRAHCLGSLSNSARGSDAWNSHGRYIHCALIMRSTANTVLEHTLGQDVVCKRKNVVRKTKVVRREKVARTVAARRARATTTGRARFEFFWRFPAIVFRISTSLPSTSYSHSTLVFTLRPMHAHLCDVIVLPEEHLHACDG